MSIRISDYAKINDKPSGEKLEIKASCGTSPVNSVARKTNTIPSELLKGAYGVIPFKGVSTKQKASHSVSFTANPLYKINLKEVAEEGIQRLVPGSFSELVLKDQKDEWALLNVEEMWSKIDKTDYTRCFTDNFIKEKDSRSYFVTEFVDSAKDLQDRITCLIETTNPKTVQNKDLFEIDLLQASPLIANKGNSAPIKGSGELSLYGAVKIAKENGFKKVGLISTNNSFYEKMGFTEIEKVDPVEGSWYELAADKFDDFLAKIAEKYNLE